VKVLIVEAHGGEHDPQAKHRPYRLFDHVMELVVTLLNCDHSRGAINHDHAKQHQSNRCREQPFIELQLLRHLSVEFQVPSFKFQVSSFKLIERNLKLETSDL